MTASLGPYNKRSLPGDHGRVHEVQRAAGKSQEKSGSPEPHTPQAFSAGSERAGRESGHASSAPRSTGRTERLR